MTGGLPDDRSNHTATLLPTGQVLIAGGNESNTTLLYQPSSGTWQATGSLSEARSQPTGILLNDGRVLLAGGENGTGAVSLAEVYVPDTGTWLTGGTMQTARTGHSAGLLGDGQVVVTGGEAVQVSEPRKSFAASADPRSVSHQPSSTAARATASRAKW